MLSQRAVRTEWSASSCWWGAYVLAPPPIAIAENWQPVRQKSGVQPMLCPHPCYEAQGGGNANGQEGLHVMVHYDLSNLFEKSKSLWCFNSLLSEAKNTAVWSDNDVLVTATPHM
jgi:hypothetical protein